MNTDTQYHAMLASATASLIKTRNLRQLLLSQEAGLGNDLVRSLPLKSRAPCFYTATEVARMIAVVRPEERGYVILQSHFGLRHGEAQRMEATNIDLSIPTIGVPGVHAHLRARTISGGQDAQGSQVGVPGGAWRLLAAFPFQPLQRSARIVEQVMSRAAGRYIPGGLRLTATANLVTLIGRNSATLMLGMDPTRLTSHHVQFPTFEHACGYFEMEPVKYVQAT